MSSKENSLELVSNYDYLFRCPLCYSSMKVVDLRSLICSNNHTFDFAKQGYVNMLTRPINSNYNKALFQARQKIIMESDLYTLLHKEISRVINRNIDGSNNEVILLDAGSGEGSHLQRIVDENVNGTIQGIGIDISKEGVRIAAKNYKSQIWLVGDLANSPLADQSCHAIVNILSPANYEEFKRVLVSDGLMIKVVPRANYLIELREALFDSQDKKSYKNDKSVSLFEQHFHLIDELKLCYTKDLNQTELTNLIQMSPLTWNVSKKDIERVLLKGEISKITIDFDILVGRKGISNS